MRDDGEQGRATSRTALVMEAIRGRIAARRLRTSDRLPSIRSLAATLGVSPSTVVEAYDRLAAEGVVRARPGSGFYVTQSGLPTLGPAKVEPSPDRAVDPFWVSRQSLDATAAVLKPGCGWLPADWLPADGIRRALRAVSRGSDALLADYGGTRGPVSLRRHLQTRLAEDGIDAAEHQILLTGSGTQALDLVCRLLLRPGDAVLLDDPCYFNFRAVLKALGVRAVSVPFTAAGPDTAAFERAVAQAKPRLYLTNSALHNPTGATISLQAAHRVLSIATAHGMTIVEDEIFADFEPVPSPRLAALDGLERVVRIGSFSKTLSASLRCGYVIARAEWIEELIDLQVATSFAGASPVAAEAIAHLLTAGSYRKHLEAIRLRLAAARRKSADQLESLGILPWLMPSGGFYLWCRLPGGLDAAAVARRALEEDVVLAPGNVFSPSQSAGDFMRFNVAQCDDPRLWAVLRRAMAGPKRDGAAVAPAARIQAEAAK